MFWISLDTFSKFRSPKGEKIGNGLISDPEYAKRTLDFALRMAALLPSVRALFDGNNSAESRPVWERHILAIVDGIDCG